MGKRGKGRSIIEGGITNSNKQKYGTIYYTARFADLLTDRTHTLICLLTRGVITKGGVDFEINRVKKG